MSLMQVIVQRVPGGDRGTRRTIKAMLRLVRKETAHPLVRGLALRVTGGIPGRDALAQVYAIRAFLETAVEFTRDPDGNELLHSPARLAKFVREGKIPLRVDCDDVAILAAALGRAVGLKARFVVVGFGSPRAPFRHVWTELRSPRGGEWYEMDVTRSQQSLPSAITRRWVVHV